MISSRFTLESVGHVPTDQRCLSSGIVVHSLLLLILARKVLVLPESVWHWWVILNQIIYPWQ